MSAAYIQMHFRLDFIMEVNTMNLLEQLDPGLYCLQKKLPKT